MFEVDTVVTLHAGRGPYPILDLIAAIAWGFDRPYHIVVLNTGEKFDVPDNVTVLAPDLGEKKFHPGFIRNLGVKWAIDEGVQTKQFMLLDDACMILQHGLDVWSYEQMTKTNVGILGVVEQFHRSDAYARCTPIFDLWNLPHGDFDPDGYSLCSSAVFMSAAAAMTLYQRNLLAPDRCEQWPLPHGVYLSWVTQMLGLYQVGWGHSDKPLPPLYVHEHARARCQPGPQILSPAFSLFYSARQVTGYSEEELREAFKRHRGEPAKTREPMRPVVSPTQRGPTVLG